MKNFIRILKQGRQYWKYLIVAGISLLAITAFNLVTPWKVRELVDILSKEGTKNMASIRNIAIILAVAYIARAFFSYLYRYFSHVAAWRLVADMRVIVYEHLQKLSLSFYQDKQTGQLMSRAINDTATFEVLIAHAVPDLVTNVLILVGTGILLFVINPLLAALTLIPIPFLVLGSGIFTKKVLPNFREAQENPQRENKLEGYLFPDTYFFDPKAGERAIIEKFLDNFDAKFKPEFYERAKELNMTVDEVIILASIIERETALPEERPIVSSVFHNRLKSSDPNLKKLESCATVQYVLYKTQGKMKEKLSDEDTKIDHPYNTYLYEGLPPGPICCPGLASIEAALYPDEESEYLYFVAKGDGSHEFSRTLAEHLEAVKKYQSN